jgi:hypothetical protein
MCIMSLRVKNMVIIQSDYLSLYAYLITKMKENYRCQQKLLNVLK